MGDIVYNTYQKWDSIFPNDKYEFNNNTIKIHLLDARKHLIRSRKTYWLANFEEHSHTYIRANNNVDAVLKLNEYKNVQTGDFYLSKTIEHLMSMLYNKTEKFSIVEELLVYIFGNDKEWLVEIGGVNIIR
jgi:hypothetical protein